MKNNKVILFADNDNEHNYFKSYLESARRHNFHFIIIFLYSKCPSIKTKKNKKTTYVYLNIPNLNENKCEEDKMSKLGDRVIDYLILEQLINGTEKICFCFSSFNQYFIQQAIKNRLNSLLISTYGIQNLKQSAKYPLSTNEIIALWNKKKINSFRRKYYDYFEHKFLKNLDLILVNSKSYIDFLIQLYNLDQEKLVNWPYSVNIEDIKVLSTSINFSSGDEKSYDRLIVFKVDKYTKANYDGFFKYLSKSEKYRCVIIGECQLDKIPSDYKTRSKITFINNLTQENENLILPYIDLFITEERESNEPDLLLKILLLGIPILAINKEYKFDDFRKLLNTNEENSNFKIPKKITGEDIANFIEQPSGLFHFLPSSLQSFSKKRTINFLNKKIHAYFNAE